MNIQTKYNVGDWVYIIHRDSIYQMVVRHLSIDVINSSVNVKYYFNQSHENDVVTVCRYENEVYAAFEEIEKHVKVRK